MDIERQTWSYIYIHTKQILTLLKNFFFIHGIKYIKQPCANWTKSRWISGFSRPTESSIEHAEQETRSRVKLNPELKRSAVSYVLEMDYLEEDEWRMVVGRWSRGCTLLIRRFVDVHGRAGAHEMLVTVNVIDPWNWGPKLGFRSHKRLEQERGKNKLVPVVKYV